MPTTRRVPSDRTSLSAFAAAQRPLNGSCTMPIDSDQKYAVLPTCAVLPPTASPLELMSFAQLCSPPRVPSSRELPVVYQNSLIATVSQRARNNDISGQITGGVGTAHGSLTIVQLFSLPLPGDAGPPHRHGAAVRGTPAGAAADDSAVGADREGNAGTSGEILSAAARSPHGGCGCGCTLSCDTDDHLRACAEAIDRCRSEIRVTAKQVEPTRCGP